MTASHKVRFSGDHFLSGRVCKMLVIGPQGLKGPKWQWVNLSLIVAFVEMFLGTVHAGLTGERGVNIMNYICCISCENSSICGIVIERRIESSV